PAPGMMFNIEHHTTVSRLARNLVPTGKTAGKPWPCGAQHFAHCAAGRALFGNEPAPQALTLAPRSGERVPSIEDASRVRGYLQFAQAPHPALASLGPPSPRYAGRGSRSSRLSKRKTAPSLTVRTGG